MRRMAEFQAGKVLSILEDVYKLTAYWCFCKHSAQNRATRHQKRRENFDTSSTQKGSSRKGIGRLDPRAIRQKIHFFYTVKKEVPTIAKLLAQLKEDIDYDGSREHLRKLLKRIGFRFKKCKTNRQALVEKPIIAHKREEYLKIILDNRNLPIELQKYIIYLDESYKLKKCWQSIVGISTN